MPVTTIVGQFAAGRTHQQVLVDFPDLGAEDNDAALRFARPPWISVRFRTNRRSGPSGSVVVAGLHDHEGFLLEG